MKRRISLWQLMGFAVTSLSGTLLHFLYDWTNESVWAAPFSGVNESTWEHMKLLFFPLFIYAIFQSFYFKEYRGFWCIKARGTILGITLIPLIYYTYNGVIGKSPDWVNIAIFFISAAVVYIYETKLFNSDKVKYENNKICFIVLCLICIMFVVFTFITPEINIFKDPIDGSYGI